MALTDVVTGGRFLLSRALYSLLFTGLLPAVMSGGCSNGGRAHLPGPDEFPTGQCAKVEELLDQGGTDVAAAFLDALEPAEKEEPWAVFCRGLVALEKASASQNPAEHPGLEEALDCFSTTLKARPEHYMARVKIGKTLGLLGRLVDGVKALEGACYMSPDRADAFFEIGRLYVYSGEVEAGMRFVEAGISKEPDRADGVMLRGEIRVLYRYQPDEGLNDMRNALKMDPDLPGGAQMLAKILNRYAVQALNKGKLDDVLEITGEMLEYLPDSVQALKLRGQVHEKSGDAEKALADFQKCFELDPSDDEAVSLLARARISRGYRLLFLKRREDALEFFRKAVELGAADVDVTVVSRILEENEKNSGTVSQVTPGDMDAKEARSLFENATALIEAGEPEKAFDMLVRSLEIFPENPYTHHQAGIALDMMGKTDEAVEQLLLALEQAEKLDVRIPSTYVKLADIEWRMERYDQVEKYLDMHAEQFPGLVSDPVVKRLRRLLILK